MPENLNVVSRDRRGKVLCIDFSPSPELQKVMLQFKVFAKKRGSVYIEVGHALAEYMRRHKIK
jgi:hypothetical protein